MSTWRVLLLLLLPAVALGDERLLDFHADILVRQDGWITVTETIVVRAEGRKIRRGLTRDYPTRYRDSAGNNVEVEYKPRSDEEKRKRIVDQEAKHRRRG